MQEKEYIEQIIYRHLNKEASDLEEASLSAWLEDNPENKIEYEALLQLWNESSGLANELHFDEELAWKSLENKFNSLNSENKNSKSRNLFRNPLAIAAAVALVLLNAGLVYYFINSRQSTNVTIIASEANLPIQLPDGSSVLLRKGSTLKYDRSFNSSGRNVLLSGEANFDIVHNEKMEFRISTNRSIIEILGTSFTVITSNDSDQVFVTKGIVKFVDIKDEHQMVILSAGQKASLVGKVFAKDTITNNNYLSWQTGILKFENTPLKGMIASINQYYHANIIMSDSLAAKSDTLKVTLRFDNNTLSQVLEEIQLITGLKAEQKNDSIILH